MNERHTQPKKIQDRDVPESGATRNSAAGFFAYRKARELDFFPTSALRWWLFFIIVWIYCVEQLERLKIGSVLPFLFAEFNVDIRDWGNLGMMGAASSAVGAFVMSNVAERFGRYVCIAYSILAMTIISVLIALADKDRKY